MYKALKGLKRGIQLSRMVEVLLDSLYDSIKIFLLAFLFHFLLSFLEDKIANLLKRREKWGPVFGGLFGSVPQCGVPIVSSDLFLKGHITLGTLISIFIACNDEALPILFTVPINSPRFTAPFLLLFIKLILAILVGVTVDLFLRKQNEKVDEHLEHCSGEASLLTGCCHHHIDDSSMQKENGLHRHFMHPFFHSLKIFIYSFVIIFLFGTIIYFVGESNIENFLISSYYLTPLYSSIIGLIPNCASSVLLTNLFNQGLLPFSSLLAGLTVNAGLGPLFLFKNKKFRFKAILIYFGLFILSLGIGYAFLPLTTVLGF